MAFCVYSLVAPQP